MKKLFTLFFLLNVSFYFAQAPLNISYQGVARNSSGTVIANQQIAIKFDIRQGSSLGTVVFTEQHQNITTNAFGLFTTYIGSVSNLGVVNWANGPFFIEISVDPANGTSFSSVGVQQLMSVPYALYAGSAPAPSVSYTNNVLTIGSSSITINSSVTYTAGNGIGISGGVISNTSPDQVVNITGANVIGTYPNYTITSVAQPTTTIVGGNNITLNQSGTTYTVSAPSYSLSQSGNTIDLLQNGSSIGTATLPIVTNYTAGNGIDITGGVISNTMAPVTPTITGTGAATVTSAGNTFTVDVPASQVYTAGNGIDITGGVISNTMAPVTPTITGTGAATVTSAGNTFTVDVPASQVYTAGNGIDITGGVISNTMVPVTPTLSVSGNSISISPGNTQTLPTYSLTQSGNNIDLLQNGSSVATVTLTPPSSTSLTAGNTNITLNQSGNNYTITPVTPTLNVIGGSLTGAYPTQTLTVPSSSTTLIQGANVALQQAGNTYTVSSVTPTLNVIGGSLTGSYPTQTLTVASNSITGTGVATVNNAAPNFTVNVPMSTYNNTTGVFTTGTQTISVAPTLSLTGNVLRSGPASNTVTLPSTNLTLNGVNNNILSAGSNSVTLNTYTVGTNLNMSSGPNYTISAPGYSLSSSTNTLTLTNGITTTTAAIAVPLLSYNTNTATSVPGGTLSLGAQTVNLNGWDLNGNGGTTPGVNFIGTTDNQPLNFNTNNIPRIGINTSTLSGSGGVVIGGNINNTSLGRALTLQGVLTATNTSDQTYGHFAIRGGTSALTNQSFMTFNNSIGSRLGLLGDFSTADNDMYLISQNNLKLTVGSFTTTPAITVEGASGRVGISNSTPTASLDVAGTLRLVDGTQGLGKILTSDATGLASWQNAPATAWIKGAGTVTLAVGSDAVGIGTNTPQSSLHLTNAVGQQFRIGHQNQPGYEWIWDVNGTSHLSLMNENNGTPVTRLFVDVNNGFMGLGTISPNALLDVQNNGTAANSSQPIARITNANPAVNSNGMLEIVKNAGSGAILFASNTYSTGDGLSVNMSHANNGSNAVQAVHLGTGNAGYFEINNSSNSSTALAARISAGIGAVITGQHAGTGGRVADFRIYNNSNNSDVVFAQTAGTGNAGFFENFNASSNAGAIAAFSNGNGSTISASNTNTNNVNASAIFATASYGTVIRASASANNTIIQAFNSNSGGTASVVYSQHSGSGAAFEAQANTGPGLYAVNNSSVSATIQANNSNASGDAFKSSANSGRAIYSTNNSSTAPTAYMSNFGSYDVLTAYANGGRAIYTQNTSNPYATVESTNGGTGPVIYAYKSAGTTGGIVANIANNSSTNGADAVFVTNNGAGAAIHAVSGPTVSSGSNTGLWLEGGHLKSTQSATMTVTTVSTSISFSGASYTLSNATDVKGMLQAVMTTTSSTSIYAGSTITIKVNFAKSYTTNPIVVATPLQDMMGLSYFINNINPTYFYITIKNSTASTINLSSLNMSFNYVVIE